MPNFRSPNWYGLITYEDGRTLHSEPWMTEWAAQQWAIIMQDRAKWASRG